VLAPAPQQVNAVSHNTAYGISLTENARDESQRDTCAEVVAAQGAYGRPSRLAAEDRPVARSYGGHLPTKGSRN